MMAKKKALARIPKANDSAGPSRRLPDGSWEHHQLYLGVREAISALPIYFRTETQISGIMATDLHTLNNVLGATIEEQVVRTLNLIRKTWDPREEYALYSFYRQPQTFPDVRLRHTSNGDTLMGLELKGWYLLAKEEEPSLRFTTTEKACAEQDLIVVVPWVLSNVISGVPMLFEPYIESAKYAAEYRNFHWQQVRQTKLNVDISIPEAVSPYPSKSTQISDRPASDAGGNFGRIARTGIMDDYMKKLNEVLLCGVKCEHWRRFLKIFQEGTTDESAKMELERFRGQVQHSLDIPSSRADAVLRILLDLESFL